MVDLRTVDLSILRLLAETIELNSLISILNWSRRFFSLRFRDFLDKNKNINNTVEHNETIMQTKILNTDLQQHKYAYCEYELLDGLINRPTNICRRPDILRSDLAF
jgi:hypothetical protein